MIAQTNQKSRSPIQTVVRLSHIILLRLQFLLSSTVVNHLCPNRVECNRDANYQQTQEETISAICVYFVACNR